MPGDNFSGILKKTSPKGKRTPARHKSSLSETAYNSLINKLLTRKLAPGDIINRRQIADELKMSVAPVLEAMVQLENDGFLESIPRKGTIVKAIKLEDVRGLMVLREALETEACRFYCGETVRKNAVRLRKLAQAVEDNYDQPEISWKMEFEFHRALVELAGFPALLNVYDKVMRYKIFMVQNMLLVAHQEPEHNNHLALLEELGMEDADRASRALRRHIRAGKTGLLNLPEE